MPTSKTRLLAVLLALGLPAAAHAAPVFPGASGVGLDPPPGMTAARTFNGFQGGAASIIITELPTQAYSHIEQSRDMFVKRFEAKEANEVDINGVHGFMVKGQQVSGPVRFRKWVLVLDGKDETAVVSAQVPADDTAISDAQVATALHSIVFRTRPGLEQQVAALPFSIGNLDGFRVSAAELGVAAILVDGPKDADPTHSQAHMIVALNNGTPPKDDRAAFAKGQLENFQAVRTTDVKSSKLFDVAGTQWAQVDAQGSEGPQETPVAITYFIRFEKDHFYTIVCVAPQAEATRYADRFKTVALSVTPKA